MKNKDMSNAKQTECDTLAWRETLITLVETLSGAFFFIDDTETIVYANASAQVITGATLEELRGNPFWRSAPQLVSTALYQAVLKTRQTQEPTEVEYVSHKPAALRCCPGWFACRDRGADARGDRVGDQRGTVRRRAPPTRGGDRQTAGRNPLVVLFSCQSRTAPRSHRASQHGRNGPFRDPGSPAGRDVPSL